MKDTTIIKSLVSNSTKETKALGAKLGRLLKAGDTIALIGELGSGKTVFTKGIAESLGVKGAEYVNSPSFVIIKEYKGRVNLYHFDLYRIDRLYEIEYLSPEEYLSRDGVVVIEWADKLSRLSPKESLQVSIGIIGSDKRRITLKPHGKRYIDIVDRYIKPKA